MTPAARVQAAIEVLDQITSGNPAEKALTNWARRSRFAGSKDRAAVRDHVYHVLRRMRSLAALGGGTTGRALMLGGLREVGDDPEAVFTGQGHAPAVLEDTERSAGHPPQSPSERADLPDWLYDRFCASLGAEADTQAAILRNRAPVTLRVNVRKITVPMAQSALAEEGIVAVESPVVDTALMVTEGARKVAGSGAYQSGLVEIQDASSQAAMAMIEVPEGGAVLDYCAGGGGKVLALAARHEAQFTAHDVAPARMSDLPARAERAGVAVRVAKTKDLPQMGLFDVVLTDVPCSGSGTWRRAPMGKWDLTPERLQELCDLQRQIVRDALALVKPGGQLIYSTCSVLREENEAVIEGLVAGADLRVIQSKRWEITDENDGFFCAVLGKRAVMI